MNTNNRTKSKSKTNTPTSKPKKTQFKKTSNRKRRSTNWDLDDREALLEAMNHHGRRWDEIYNEVVNIKHLRTHDTREYFHIKYNVSL
jgi:hypothetical protein